MVAARFTRPPFSRRERQIMDVLHRLRRATAATVRADLPSAPSYSAVRALLRILEEKGHVRHRLQGPRYVYEPVTPLEVERRSALRHLVRTLFDGSPEDAAAALLDSAAGDLDPEKLDDLARRIAEARREGR
jgi:BlaI family transcriptional regulator, penicillinase repressor